MIFYNPKTKEFLDKKKLSLGEITVDSDDNIEIGYLTSAELYSFKMLSVLFFVSIRQVVIFVIASSGVLALIV